jgi:hypothetical protein
MLQHLDLPAQRRLGHVQTFGCTAKVEFLAENREAVKLFQVINQYATCINQCLL